MNNIQVKSFRGEAKIINNLSFILNDEVQKINLNERIEGQYNFRLVFEKLIENPTYHDSILGKQVGSLHIKECKILNQSNIQLVNPPAGFAEHTELNLNGIYDVFIKIFIDTPINNYLSLEVIPVPTNLITIYVCFDENRCNQFTTANYIQKYFDSYSHLGFFLTDLDTMRYVIEREYGNKDLNLINEFTNSTIIDKLFESESLMVVWGINPYTYPIYSTEKINMIKPLLGNVFREEGLFNIKEDFTALSLVPGHELSNWPKFLKKEWPKIKLFGKGKITHLRPYALEDSDQEIVLTSFLIYRSYGILDEAKPLINIDLLYS